ncbi:uncharacterized protein TNCV_1742221 [Trichonephila clavipes]|nr:uncharacterized protein TNCV_1742221 [Trichonephila clavipes]
MNQIELRSELSDISDEDNAVNETYESRILEGESSSATRGLLATDHVILNHGQVTWTTPELAPPLLTTTPHQREDVSALDRFNVHRCPTRRVFSGTGIELVTRQATIRYLYHSATAATTATAGSDVVQSGRPIFDDFFQHLWPYIGNNTANVVFQIVKRLWLIRIDQ